MMKKMITVADLKKQLERLEEYGYADAEVWYRPEDSVDVVLERGLWDCWEDPDDGKKYIFLA